MARKSSVRVQMADDPSELPTPDQIAAGLVAGPDHQESGNPREPSPDDEPVVPPANFPDSDDDDDDTVMIPDDDDDDDDDEDAPAEPPHIAASPKGKPIGKIVRYEARISIVDAYQYPGAIASAPEWVDRNWVAYADEDVLRKIASGPALRVPTYRGDDVYCRIGDYVARQEVRLTADQPGEIKIEVWPQDQFERLFIPVTSTQTLPPAPAGEI